MGGNMKKGYFYQTIIGNIGIIEEDGFIIEISFEKTKTNFQIEETKLIQQTHQQLEEYFAGKRTEFTIPIKMLGTPFEEKVWQALTTIPYGETRSYQDIAIQIGNPKACRAVGMANHKNPLPIIVPCHRVIGKNRKLVGYAGGIGIKEKLLSIEKFKDNCCYYN